MSELYFSVDVETDGPIPGPHSMLSFGAVALDLDGNEHAAMEWNLDLLEEAKPHPDTQRFWMENPAAYRATREATKPSSQAMNEFVNLVDEISGKLNLKPVFVAYPAGFDFLFMYWYMIQFVGRSPFSFSALDMKSYAMAKLSLPYRQSTKRNFPKAWIPQLPHTHIALDDAREQGLIFLEMLRYKPA